MHPELVRPAGKRAELDQRPPPALFDRSPAGLRGLALWIGDHPPTLGARRALVERQVDQPAPALRHAFKPRPLGYSYLARLASGRKAAARAWISRPQQTDRESQRLNSST